LRLKQKNPTVKKLVLNSQRPQINKVSSTPYMIGVSDAPRMKRILEQLNDIKKPVETELKHKIMSNKYLNNY
jgi:predicted thioesterase